MRSATARATTSRARRTEPGDTVETRRRRGPPRRRFAFSRAGDSAAMRPGDHAGSSTIATVIKQDRRRRDDIVGDQDTLSALPVHVFRPDRCTGASQVSVRLENFTALVPSEMHARSGSVFYSGRSAFENRSDLYILGLNPGGDPVRQAQETIGASLDAAVRRTRIAWSAYQDESWAGRPPGTYKMQPRVTHMLRRLGRSPRETPASNVVFVRSGREAALKAEKASLLRACWPVHRAVIDRLGVRVVLCFGGTAGKWTRELLGAHELVDSFQERNDRGWTSQSHRAPDGRMVVTATHPGIADWTNPSTDPTDLVANALSA